MRRKREGFKTGDVGVVVKVTQRLGREEEGRGESREKWAHGARKGNGCSRDGSEEETGKDWGLTHTTKTKVGRVQLVMGDQAREEDERWGSGQPQWREYLCCAGYLAEPAGIFSRSGRDHTHTQTKQASECGEDEEKSSRNL